MAAAAASAGAVLASQIANALLKQAPGLIATAIAARPGKQERQMIKDMEQERAALRGAAGGLTPTQIMQQQAAANQALAVKQAQQMAQLQRGSAQSAGAAGMQQMQAGLIRQGGQMGSSQAASALAQADQEALRRRLAALQARQLQAAQMEQARRSLAAEMYLNTRTERDGEDAFEVGQTLRSILGGQTQDYAGSFDTTDAAAAAAGG